jgi:hypothetical protein
LVGVPSEGQGRTALNNAVGHQLAQLRRQLQRWHSRLHSCLPKSFDRQLVHPDVQHSAKRASTSPADAGEYLTAPDRYRIFAITCPFHDNAGWRWIRDNDPDGWAEAVEFDTAIRDGYPHATEQGQPLRGQYFLHRSCQPLREVDLDPPTAVTKRHLRLVAASGAEEDDPDGCSPWSCRSGTAVTPERAA